MAAARLLGSNILAATKAMEVHQHAFVNTGCLPIDQALGGGLSYGSITSIAGFNQIDKTVVAIHAAASHLTSSLDTDVAFVCTADSGLAVQLHDVITERLRKTRQVAPLITDLEHEVSNLLQRVKLMRAFDFVGILESIGEISEACSLTQRDSIRKQETPGGSKKIPNSQDEDNDSSDATNSPNELQEATSQTRRIGFVVIDNISSLLTGEITKDLVEGQSLLAGFFRSLHHLTTNYQVCIVLVNNVVVPSYQVESKRKLEEPISIFREVHGRPGLGPNYAHLVDTSLLLFDAPKIEADVGSVTEDNRGARRRSESVKVLEILGSRYSPSEGKWAAFEIRDGLHLVPINLKRTD